MKNVICILVLIIFLFGCSYNENFREENTSKHDYWNLEFQSTFKVGEETLYNCVYLTCPRGNCTSTFAIISNEQCKGKL